MILVFKPGLLFLLLIGGGIPVLANNNNNGYEKSVLLDLCQYIGVHYVRNPDDQHCSYVECASASNYDMPCAPGLKVHPNFLWGTSYPCTEKDSNDDCSYFKKHLKQIEKHGKPAHKL